MTEEKVITDRVVGLLMDHIREKELREGDFLETEKELLEKIKVSRNILREALGQLKGMGVLTSRRGSGFRIARPDLGGYFSKYVGMMFSVSPGSFREVWNLRRILELGCVALSVKNATDAQVRGLRESAEKLAELDPSSPGAFRRKLELETEFHTRLAEPARCGMLDAINGAIREYFVLMERTVSPEDSLASLAADAAEHKMIAMAFEARQADTALLCLNRHLNKN